MTDGFAHHLRLDQIRDGERFDLVADERERDGIAKRLGLKAVDRLEAHVSLSRKDDVVRATGRLVAALQQSCVVTDEPIAAHVDEVFDILFTPEPKVSEAGAELELGPADCDTVFYDRAGIDLGSAIADTLALGLDPYPRSAGAEAALKEAGVLTESEAGPFAALAQLKRDLESS